jgi:nitrate reductase assembly molybdenum cofactor insertion protein NarJ
VTIVLPSLAGRRALSRAYAEVLSYPHSPPVEAARRCADVARTESEAAAALLDAFVSLAEETPHGSLQEEYTRTFDLDTMSRSQPTCYPYVGHYLFDESHKRGAFILGLKKRFRAAGFSDDSDLGDHLVVLLRFLAVCDDETLASELVDDAILPALRRMAIAAGTADEHASIRGAYLGVLRALELSLGAGRPEPAEGPAGDETEREWLRAGDSLGIDRDWCGH